MLSQKRLVEQFIEVLIVNITMQKHYVLLQNAVFENNKNTYFSFSGDRPRGWVGVAAINPALLVGYLKFNIKGG